MEQTRNHHHSTPELSATGAGSPGTVLAAARKARGLSIEDVARRLRLTPAQVYAIESDNHAFFSAMVFARGFTRGYARLLGVEIESLLPKQVVSPSGHIPAGRLRRNDSGVPLERKRTHHLPAMIAASVLVLSGLTYFEFVLNAPPQSMNLYGRSSVILAPTHAVRPAAAFGSPSTAPVASPQSGESTLLQDVPSSPAIADNLQLKTSADPTSGMNDADVAGAKGLHFLFNNESWVEVRDAVGKVVYSRLNAPGSESVVQGEPPFSIVIGGASGVQLSYNGSRVDIASYMSEDVARLRLE